MHTKTTVCIQQQFIHWRRAAVFVEGGYMLCMVHFHAADVRMLDYQLTDTASTQPFSSADYLG